MSSTNSIDATDPVIAEMIAAGLLAAPEPAMVEPEAEIEEIAELPELELELEGAGLIEPIEMLAPEAFVTVEVGSDAELDATIEGLDEIDQALAGEELPASDADLEKLELTLAAAAAREEVYAEQESSIGVIEQVATTTPAAAALTAPRAPRAAGTTPPKREARFGAGAAGGYVASVSGDANLSALVDGLPKKVKEKAANLVDFIHKGRPLSVFTRVAVDILKAEGKISNDRLVKAFTTEATKRGMSAGYSIGTARSQAGQQIALFGRLGIASPAAGALAPNNNSPIWQALAA